VASRTSGMLPDWPRVMRATRAAQYVDLTTKAFLRLVACEEMPAPFLLNGVDAWGRLEIDAAIDVLKSGRRGVAGVEARIADNAERRAIDGGRRRWC
jgi:predicted DNA-binding transcriptional regulator AlpA